MPESRPDGTRKLSATALLIRLSDSALTAPWAWIGTLALLSLALALCLVRLELRTEGEALYPVGNRVVERSLLDRERFRESPNLILLVASKPEGPPVASPAGFRFLRQIPRDLLFATRMPLRIRSLANQLEVYRDGEGSAQVRLYLSDIPEAEEQFEARLDELRSAPLVDGLFLSRDGRAAAVYVSASAGGSHSNPLEAIRDWVREAGDGPFELSLTGPLLAESTLGEFVLRDLAVFVPVMIVMIAVLLWLSLRTLAGVLIPMVEVLAVLIWTLGTMSLLEIPVTLVTTILPVILMAMAIADEIHLLERVQANLQETGKSSIDRESLLAAVRSALRSIGRPIVLTSLTTALGFLSFLTATIRPLREFGMMAAVGILLAMVFTFTLVPAVLAVLPLGCFRRFGRPVEGSLETDWIEGLSSRLNRGWRLPLLVVPVFLLALTGLTMLRIQDSWVGNFDSESELVRADRKYNESFWGSYRFDVVFEAEPGYFATSTGVNWTDRAVRIAGEGPKVGGVVSHLVPYSGVAEYLGYEGPLPSLSREEVRDVAGRAASLAPMIDLRQFLTSDESGARIQLFVNNPDYSDSILLRDYLRRELDRAVQGAEVGYHFSGDIPVAIEVVHSIVTNQLRSIAFVLLAVGLLLVLIFRSPGTAIVLLFPVSASVLLVLSGMGYADISLGVATSMFAAMTVGVGVDFAVHFADAQRRGRLAGLGREEAISRAFQTSGRAITWNAVVLSVGLLVLTFSALKPNHSLGLLLSAGIVVCYFMTMVILPRWLPDWVLGD